MHTAATLLHRINDPADVPPATVYDGFTELLGLGDGSLRDVMLGSVLSGLLLRGPRVDEIEALLRAALALDRQHAPAVPPAPDGVDFVAYAGSGKKSFKTFNISMASALVAAAGGAKVIKLGSCSASSVTGSGDFMDHVGAPCGRVPDDEMVQVAAELGFGFFAIEGRIPEFDRRYGGRFHAIHALSLAFPALLTPVACSAHVYGLAHPAVEISARLLTRFGLPNATVINSAFPCGGMLDELAAGARVRVARVTAGQPDPDIAGEIEEHARAGALDTGGLAQRAGAQDNIAVALKVLAGRGRGGARDAVVLNAALLLRTAGVVSTFRRGLDRASEVVASGAALDLLHVFVRAIAGSDARLRALLTPSRFESAAAAPATPGRCACSPELNSPSCTLYSTRTATRGHCKLSLDLPVSAVSATANATG